jgi:hypothetical protein
MSVDFMSQLRGEIPDIFGEIQRYYVVELRTLKLALAVNLQKVALRMYMYTTADR